MNEVSIFEQASRLGLEFSYKGTIGVNDLWHLTVRELDTIYKSLKASVQSEEGLLSTRTSQDKELELKMAVVKHVFEIKQDEARQAKEKAEKKQKREKLATILAQKEDNELLNKSADEIRQLMTDLE